MQINVGNKDTVPERISFLRERERERGGREKERNYPDDVAIREIDAAINARASPLEREMALTILDVPRETPAGEKQGKADVKNFMKSNA